MQNLTNKSMEQLRNCFSIEKENKDIVNKMDYKERKKKQAGGNIRFMRDRNQCTGRHELRKEEWRKESCQHRKKGWYRTTNRKEEKIG